MSEVTAGKRLKGRTDTGRNFEPDHISGADFGNISMSAGCQGLGAQQDLVGDHASEFAQESAAVDEEHLVTGRSRRRRLPGP